MEEIDMNMSAVWEHLEEGQRIIEAEEHKEQKEKLRFEKVLEEAKQILFSWLPDVMQPYAKLLDIEVFESQNELRPDFGWFVLKIPDLALITAFVQRGKPPKISYWVHDPAKVGDEIDLNGDWGRAVVYKKLEDHRVALARAYDVMRRHKWVEHGTAPCIPAGAGVPDPKSEVYEPVEGEFGSFQMDEGYVQFMIDKRLKHYGLI